MMIDMHSHILPGLDDGADDWDQALAMARIAVEDGIAEMVCTPHWVLGKYENSREAILERMAELQTLLAREKVPLLLHAGAELRIEMSLPGRVKAGTLLTVNGSHYVLIELPGEVLPANLEEFFWNFQMLGYRPILSHVERNAVLKDHPRRLVSWVEAGILTQITAASLTGEVSEEVSDHARMLVEHRLIHMLVTDTHSLRMRKPVLSEARSAVAQVAGEAMAERLTLGIPRCILDDKPVPVLDPLPLQEKKKRWWRK